MVKYSLTACYGCRFDIRIVGGLCMHPTFSNTALFQKVRNIGMLLTALAAAIFGLPGELPQAVIEIAAVTAITGSVMAGLGQSAVKDE